MDNGLTPSEKALKMGLTAEEYNCIKTLLGREPNHTELCIYAVMWSEHASRKSSFRWLHKLPRKGNCILIEAGLENAGVVDIGNGLACVFKMESSNHPCAIAPFNGASTGVGAIHRDIITMGAMPIALIPSLRFGISNEETVNKLNGKIIAGIGHYNNIMGIPITGGEIFFDPCYAVTPLVNLLSAGIVKKDKIILGIAPGPGNPVFILGGPTGRDALKSAIVASSEVTRETIGDLSAVKVGDPLKGVALLEAVLELNESNSIAGMQDIGAGGLVCAAAEMASRSKHGMELHVDKLPLRVEEAQDWEILLSESQEQMLVVIKKGKENTIKEIAKKWDLHATCIGEVIREDLLSIFNNENRIANVPPSSLVAGMGAPAYERDIKEPLYHKELKKFKIDQVPEPADLREVFWRMLKNPNLASKKNVFEQFDTMAGATNMTTNFPSDASVINIKGSETALLLSVNGNSRYVQAAPEQGAAIAVAEAARNIVCSGGTPLAITNCLNFADPGNDSTYWQFTGAVKGLAKACEKFGTPVTGGNVSFYNQSRMNGNSTAILPTPVVGMLGLLKDKNYHMTMAFKSKGDMIYLIGKSENDISSSEYLAQYHGIVNSPAPHFDLDFEYNVQKAIIGLIQKHMIRSAHDVAIGGLLMALTESAMARTFGFDITTDAEVRTDAFLFGEAQSRFIVTVTPNRESDFLDFMLAQKVPFSALGHVTREELRIDDISFGFINDVKKEYENAIYHSLLMNKSKS